MFYICVRNQACIACYLPTISVLYCLGYRATCWWKLADISGPTCIFVFVEGDPITILVR